VAPDPNELRRLNTEKQYYFLPYYLDVVSRHPEGITAVDAKAAVGQQLSQQFGIDIADPAHSGLNASTNRSQGDQWANNLISNHILDEYMLVVRSGRAVLYPGATDNSRTETPSGSSSLTAGQISELDGRVPARIQNRAGSMTFQRSLQLAEHVRSLSARKCAVDTPSCIPFNGRDGQPYVEVHHVIPMAQQSNTSINLYGAGMSEMSLLLASRGESAGRRDLVRSPWMVRNPTSGDLLGGKRRSGTRYHRAGSAGYVWIDELIQRGA